MIPVNRDMILIIATAVCALAIVFLFKEMNKSKQEIQDFKDFSVHVVNRLNTPGPKIVADDNEVVEETEIKEEKSKE